ncbi:reverse transcriptase domain-containing protein [Tanacetum coccineum]
MKATPRKLAYVDFDKEALVGSLARGFSDRFSLESSDISNTHKQTRSASKSWRTPSKNKDLTHLRRSWRLEDRSITQEKARKERSKPKWKRFGHQAFKKQVRTLNVRKNEGLQAFIDQFKSESSHIKGVPPILRILAFMHGHGHPELAKKLNDKIPKTVEEMFERVRAFIRGEVVAGSVEMVRPSQGDKGYICPTWTGGLEKARNRGGPREARRNMRNCHPLIETPEKQNLNKFCDYHGDRGHNTNDYYQLKKQIEEAVASEKLTHLVKDIRQNNQRSENRGRNGVKIINMIREGGNRKRPYEEGRILVDDGSSSEIMYEHCFRNLNVNIKSKLRRCRALMVGFSGETYHPLGVIDLRVTMGRTGRSKTMLMEFAIIKCRSPYNVIIGRTEMRSLRAVGSTIHSMIKFPTNQGIVTMETSREALWECIHLERVQFSWKEVQWRQREEQMSRIREEVILKTKNSFGGGPNSGPVSLEKTWDREDTEEVFTISHERLDHQLRMIEDDEEKTGFHTEEGVYCFTHMLKELKNSVATLQRMVEKVLADQRGRNVEIYLEEIVIKSKSELDLVQDVEETLRKLKRVNIKIDPASPRSE